MGARKRRIQFFLGLVFPAAVSVSAHIAADKIPALWEAGDFDSAWAGIVSGRQQSPHAPVWEFYAALSLDFGLGTFRDTYEARHLYENALLLGESRARVALADNLREDAQRDDDDARLYTALHTVVQSEPEGKSLSRVGPFQFGLREARRRNLAFAFNNNRRSALQTRSPWALYNTSDLMPFNPRGNPQDLNRQQRLWHIRAKNAGAAPILAREAFMARLGLGQTVDDEAAVKATTRAAASGYADSQWELGQRYLKGKGVEKDTSQAIPLLEQGAQGNASHLADLAGYYHEGSLIPTDMKAAKRWYERAVEAGDAHSASELGRFYEHGWADTAIDFQRAKQLYRLSANRGAYWGPYNLANLILKDDPTPEERDEAHFWLEAAALDGHTKAIERLMSNQDGGVDANSTLFWARWGVAHEVKGATRVYARLLVGQEPCDYVEIERLARLVLVEGDIEFGVSLLMTVYNADDSPLRDPDTARALAEKYQDRSNIARVMQFRALINKPREDGFNFETIQAIFRRFVDEPEGAPDAALGALIMNPELSETPLADLKKLLANAKRTTGPWRRKIPPLDGIDTWDDALRQIAANCEPTAKDASGMTPYTLEGRALIHACAPHPPTLIFLGTDHDRVSLVLEIEPDGTVSRATAKSGKHTFLKYLAEDAIKQWKWAPADDPADEIISAKIDLPFNLKK